MAPGYGVAETIWMLPLSFFVTVHGQERTKSMTVDKEERISPRMTRISGESLSFLFALIRVIRGQKSMLEPCGTVEIVLQP